MPHHYRPDDFVWVPYGSPHPGKRQPLQLAHIEGSGIDATGPQPYRFLLVRKYSSSGRRWMKTKSRVDGRTVIYCTPTDLPLIERAARRQDISPPAHVRTSLRVRERLGR